MGFRQRENEHLFSHPLTVVYIPVILDMEYATQATVNTLRVSSYLVDILVNGYQLLSESNQWRILLFLSFNGILNHQPPTAVKSLFFNH